MQSNRNFVCQEVFRYVCKYFTWHQFGAIAVQNRLLAWPQVGQKLDAPHGNCHCNHGRCLLQKSCCKKSLGIWWLNSKILEVFLMITTSNVAGECVIWHQFTPNDHDFDDNLYEALPVATLHSYSPPNTVTFTGYWNHRLPSEKELHCTCTVFHVCPSIQNYRLPPFIWTPLSHYLKN